MKRATREEWKEIGTQAKIVREELFELARLSRGKMPLAITKYIQTSINALDRFRCDAENRMLATHPPLEDRSDLRVFYGRLED